MSVAWGGGPRLAPEAATKRVACRPWARGLRGDSHWRAYLAARSPAKEAHVDASRVRAIEMLSNANSASNAGCGTQVQRELRETDAASR